jgi:hypothetical protein
MEWNGKNLDLLHCSKRWTSKQIRNVLSTVFARGATSTKIIGIGRIYALNTFELEPRHFMRFLFFLQWLVLKVARLLQLKQPI